MAKSLSILDGGTSHWRLYEFDADGHLIDQQTVAPCSLDDLGQLGRGQVRVCAGMLTSATGLIETPYRETPAAVVCPRELWTPSRGWYFLPGVVDHAHQSMMRGEDLLLMDPVSVHGDGWYVLPGTHCKWIQIKRQQIVQIHSFVTGELRALLLTGPSLSVGGTTSDPQHNTTHETLGNRSANLCSSYDTNGNTTA